ncbi:hypothetical protein SCS07_02675 [Legionella pneumophila serogroup 1]
MTNDIQQMIDDYAKEQDADIACYFGNISRDLADVVIDTCRNRKLRKNIILLLTTHGGDPNAAYIISRCFQQAYKTRKTAFENDDTDKGKFSIVIDGVCKSAGTLLCLGADELIMSGNGELGPLDIQLLKEDEINERTSGLTPIQAVKFLEGEAERMFRRTFTSLKFSGMNFSTKMAAQISTDITTGLFSPIFGQIDPLRVAEVDRSLRIAQEYGFRLANGNLKENKLNALISDYPSHGFVIDREETRSLFNNVLNLTGTLRSISDYGRYLFRAILRNRENCFDFISAQVEDKKEQGEHHDE